MKIKIKQISILILSIVFFYGCGTDDLDPTIAQSKPVEGGITKVGNLYSILKGAHSDMTATGYYGRDMIIIDEVRSDNCFSNGSSGRFSTQAEFEYNPNTGGVWNDIYTVISTLNIIINQDIETLDGDQEYGDHIKGQALTLRALGHFDVLRTYGQQNAGGSLGVVIQKQFIGSPDSDLILPRSTVAEVKDDIYNDLNTAYGLMNSSFDTSKIFVSKMANKAIEARVALYFGDYARAKDAAMVVINSGKYSIASADSFVSNFAGKEASNSIFELAFSGTDNRGINGLAYIYRFPGDSPSGYGDIEVVAGVDGIFEATDVRLNILGYQDGGTRLRNMGKYPDTVNGADNVPLVRYEEVVLILAEALFELNNADPTALTYLNSIVTNRNATPYATISKDNIILERRKELMFEGFRFDDLMRTGQSIEVLGSSQNALRILSYPNDLFAYPIPIGEMNTNSNMEQNAGYN